MLGLITFAEWRRYYTVNRPDWLFFMGAGLGILFFGIIQGLLIGVVLSLLMQLNREAADLRVVQLIPRDDGAFVEQPAPPRLESRQVVLLDVYGSLFYAGARTLQARLPEPADAERPVVVLRLRGRAMLGSTAFAVLSDYAGLLADAEPSIVVAGPEDADRAGPAAVVLGPGYEAWLGPHRAASGASCAAPCTYAARRA